MNARRPTNGRHRSSPPGRQALNNLAMASHLEVENALLRDRIAELEARVAALSNARDELYAENQALNARQGPEGMGERVAPDDGPASASTSTTGSTRCRATDGGMGGPPAPRGSRSGDA